MQTSPLSMTTLPLSLARASQSVIITVTTKKRKRHFSCQSFNPTNSNIPSSCNKNKNVGKLFRFPESVQTYFLQKQKKTSNTQKAHTHLKKQSAKCNCKRVFDRQAKTKSVDEMESNRSFHPLKGKNATQWMC